MQASRTNPLGIAASPAGARALGHTRPQYARNSCWSNIATFTLHTVYNYLHRYSQLLVCFTSFPSAHRFHVLLGCYKLSIYSSKLCRSGFIQDADQLINSLFVSCVSTCCRSVTKIMHCPSSVFPQGTEHTHAADRLINFMFLLRASPCRRTPQ